MSSSFAPIRVMLASSNQIVLWGLKKFISGENPRMKVIATATSAVDTLRLVRAKQPDILLLDLYLGNDRSVDHIPDFIRDKHIYILVLVEKADHQKAIDRVMLNGASGVVYKEDPVQDILKAIEKVTMANCSSTGLILASRVPTQSLLAGGMASANPGAGKIANLSCRELSILNAFAIEAGKPNKRIAEKLYISEQTLRNSLTSIFRKLEIKNRYELFMFAKLHHHSPPVSDLTNLLPASSVSGLLPTR